MSQSGTQRKSSTKQHDTQIVGLRVVDEILIFTLSNGEVSTPNDIMRNVSKNAFERFRLLAAKALCLQSIHLAQALTSIDSTIQALKSNQQLTEHVRNEISLHDTSNIVPVDNSSVSSLKPRKSSRKLTELESEIQNYLSGNPSDDQWRTKLPRINEEFPELDDRSQVYKTKNKSNEPVEYRIPVYPSMNR